MSAAIDRRGNQGRRRLQGEGEGASQETPQLAVTRPGPLRKQHESQLLGLHPLACLPKRFPRAPGAVAVDEHMPRGTHPHREHRNVRQLSLRDEAHGHGEARDERPDVEIRLVVRGDDLGPGRVEMLEAVDRDAHTRGRKHGASPAAVGPIHPGPAAADEAGDGRQGPEEDR